jgi:single stranded DNA-binding protein (ssb)
MNSVILTGRLVRDPELRYTQTGNAVVSFSLAVDREFAKEGEVDVDYFDVVAWRNTAIFVSKYFTKGRKVAVQGRLQQRQWDDKDGNKRRTVEVVASNVEFADSKKPAEPDAAPQEPPTYTEADHGIPPAEE